MPLTQKRPTPAVTRTANLKNARAAVERFQAFAAAARAAAAASGAAPRNRPTPTPVPGTPPLTTTARGRR